MHGAFTGGFSAGYYNTVGSKEGWTPSSFSSSRSDRLNNKQPQRPQQSIHDFMDDEDRMDDYVAVRRPIQEDKGRDALDDVVGFSSSGNSISIIALS